MLFYGNLITKGEMMREELIKQRICIRNKILKLKPILDLAYKLYMRRKITYDELLCEYSIIDKKLAEIDGRLRIVSFKTRKINATKTVNIADLDKHQRKELLDSLMASLV